jgi:hypothetical protein
MFVNIVQQPVNNRDDYTTIIFHLKGDEKKKTDLVLTKKKDEYREREINMIQLSSINRYGPTMK